MSTMHPRWAGRRGVERQVGPESWSSGRVASARVGSYDTEDDHSPPTSTGGTASSHRNRYRAMTNRAIERLLALCDTALANVHAEDIRPVVEPYGITEALVADARSKRDRLRRLNEDRAELYGRARSKTAEIDALSQTVRDTLVRHVRLARVTLGPESDAYNRLRLNESITQAREQWLPYARAFYRTLQEDEPLSASLAPVNVTSDAVAAQVAAIQSLTTLLGEREAADGQAQEMTVERDRAREDLTSLVTRLREMASVAAEAAGRPQMMEQLGFTVRSGS